MLYIAAVHPVRAAVLDANAMDAAGVVAMLARHEDRIQVVDVTSGEADVILYGVRKDTDHDGALHVLLRDHEAAVVVLGWEDDRPQLDAALRCGADGQLSKTMVASELVSGIERLHRRRRRRLLASPWECRPAVLDAGLTGRELEVLCLITRGLSNQEMAETMFVSINSVKTYVRSAYRKIGVTRRSQAVSWGVEQLLHVSSRRVSPAE